MDALAVKEAPIKPVVIVIPIYNAAQDLQECLQSVARYTAPELCQIILINDASPEPHVENVLLQAKQELISQKFEVLCWANEQNLGFVKTANRGLRFALQNQQNVLLLNSDTLVTENWLTTLLEASQSVLDAGTLTPFSNSANLCSLPFLEANPDWESLSAQQLEKLPKTLQKINFSQQVMPVPTAHGFCMWINYKLLQQVGVFNEDCFSLGYGEENDLSMRALKAGYQNYIGLKSFVFHKGSRSFQKSKHALKKENALKLMKLHPQYPTLIQNYVKRNALLNFYPWFYSQLLVEQNAFPGLLIITHGLGGGSKIHTQKIQGHFTKFYRTYVLEVHSTFLKLLDGNKHEYAYWADHFTEREWQLPLSFNSFQKIISDFKIGGVWFQTVSFLESPSWSEFLQTFKIPFVVFLHDFHAVCPQYHFWHQEGRYCGGETDDKKCQKCVANLAVDVLAWRQKHLKILKFAQQVFVPDDSARALLVKYDSSIKVLAIPHAFNLTQSAQKFAKTLETWLPQITHSKINILFLGIFSEAKGIGQIENFMSLLASSNLFEIKVHILGELRRPLSGRYQYWGPYSNEQLGAFLKKIEPHLMVIPSQVPETFSFTLSEAWLAGIPTVVTDLGALKSRMERNPELGWILPAKDLADQLLELVKKIQTQPSLWQQKREALLAFQRNEVTREQAHKTDPMWLKYQEVVYQLLNKQDVTKLGKEMPVEYPFWEPYLRQEVRSTNRIIFRFFQLYQQIQHWHLVYWLFNLLSPASKQSLKNWVKARF